MAFQQYDWKYQQERKRRIAYAATKIAERDEAVRAGRVVPANAELPIGTGRRVQAAVLFLDICSFTTRPSNTEDEQEDLLRALSIFFTEMFRIVKDYGGDVEKNTGDGLMAYFADNGDGNGAERAVACAMTMMASNAELTPHVLKTAAPFEFRIAIDYGPITVAQIGAPRGFGSIVAIGVTANIANKMLRFAKGNQIVIGEQVGRALSQPWQQFCRMFNQETGFVYLETGATYPYYLFDAHWKQPTMPLSELLASAPIPPPPSLFAPPSDAGRSLFSPPRKPSFPLMMEILAGKKK